MSVFAAICFAITLLATIVSAAITIGTLGAHMSAPQEASAFALALVVSVVPYIFSRSVDMMGRPSVQRVEIVNPPASQTATPPTQAANSNP
jgi:hypothetical protein